MAKVKRTKTRRAAASGIQAWQDDPMGLPLTARPLPNLSAAPLKFKIKGAAPKGPRSLVFTGRDSTGRTRSATLTLDIQ